jgi:hypothetical protein
MYAEHSPSLANAQVNIGLHGQAGRLIGISLTHNRALAGQFPFAADSFTAIVILIGLCLIELPCQVIVAPFAGAIFAKLGTKFFLLGHHSAQALGPAVNLAFNRQQLFSDALTHLSCQQFATSSSSFRES